jgi:3-dehydroquinate dehydratase-2
VKHPNGEVLVLSGPNLDLLGEREPEIYGTATLADHVATAQKAASRFGLGIHHVQSNHEGDLIEAIHQARSSAVAIVINAGALTHTSWALHDALAAFDGAIIELHLSNPAAREPFRHVSTIAPVANGVIAGFGDVGYDLALEAVARCLSLEEA